MFSSPFEEIARQRTSSNVRRSGPPRVEKYLVMTKEGGGGGGGVKKGREEGGWQWWLRRKAPRRFRPTSTDPT